MDKKFLTNFKEIKICGRSLESNPSTKDIFSATFLHTNTFAIGEIVLVPRSRGG